MRLKELETKGAKVLRDGEYDRLGLATESFPGEKVLTFCADLKYLSSATGNPSVTCLITTDAIADSVPENFGVIIVDAPKTFYYQTHNRIAKKRRAERTMPSQVDKTARIHPSVVIAKHNVKIGKNTIIGPNTVIHEFVTIGDDVIIGPNNVLGGPAYQFYMDGEDLVNVLTMGELVIEDKVETQSSVSIDNAVFKTATVGKNTKIDSYAQIAHDFICGVRCLIMAHAVISGRVTMGDEVYIGPNVSIVNGLMLGNHSKASIGSVVTRDVKEGQAVTGNFAIEHKKWINFVKKAAK